MLGGIVGGLIIAWILSLFHVDIMFIQFVHEFFKITISTSSYYIFFGFFGIISSFFTGSYKHQD